MPLTLHPAEGLAHVFWLWQPKWRSGGAGRQVEKGSAVQFWCLPPSHSWCVLSQVHCRAQCLRKWDQSLLKAPAFKYPFCDCWPVPRTNSYRTSDLCSCVVLWKPGGCSGCVNSELNGFPGNFVHLWSPLASAEYVHWDALAQVHKNSEDWGFNMCYAHDVLRCLCCLREAGNCRKQRTGNHMLEHVFTSHWQRWELRGCCRLCPFLKGFPESDLLGKGFSNAGCLNWFSCIVCEFWCRWMLWVLQLPLVSEQPGSPGLKLLQTAQL